MSNQPQAPALAPERPGAEELADRRPAVRCLVAEASCRLACETEVQDLHAAIGGDEDILRFQIAMDDPLLVCGGQTICDISADLQHLPDRQGAVFQPRAKRLALEQLHDGVRSAFVLPEVVDGEDVGMRQRGDGAGLAFEARARGLVRGEARRQDLDSHGASELGIGGAIDFTHAARTEQPDDLVLAKPGSDHPVASADCPQARRLS